MAYTSFSPNNERFGFQQSGTFRCAYGWERLFIIIGGIVILAVAAAIIFLWVSLENYMGSNVEVSVYITDGISYGLTTTAMSALLVTGILLLVGYIVIIGILRVGQSYRFYANEEYFDITPPQKNARHIIIYYKDVTAVFPDERGFLLTSGGIDVTILTKNGRLLFQTIHTSGTKAKGIEETPFNIVRERAGLVPPPQYTGR